MPQPKGCVYIKKYISGDSCMGKNKGFIMTQRSKTTRKTITKTVVVPPQEKDEDIYAYYLRLKKLGLRLPKK